MQTEFRAGEDHIVVRDDFFSIGDRLDRVGLDAYLDSRLLRVLVLLAVRRIGASEDGWTSALQLALLVDNSAKVAGIRKFLERRIVANFRSGNLVESNLPSRGPYRLAVPPAYVHVPSAAAASVLFGPSVVARGGFLAVDELSEVGGGLLDQGRFVSASRRLQAEVMRRASCSRTDDDVHQLVEMTLSLASCCMEAGSATTAIAFAERAVRLALENRRFDCISQAHVIKAHAYGQSDREFDAFAEAKAALSILPTKAGSLQRQILQGTVAQYLARIGRHERALASLARVRERATTLGSASWAGVWALRETQAALDLHNLSLAEQRLALAMSLSAESPLNIPMQALLLRVAAQFFAHAGQRDEMLSWWNAAYEFGVRHQMHHQLKLLESLARVHPLLLESTASRLSAE